MYLYILGFYQAGVAMEYSKVNEIIVANAVRKGIRDIEKDSKRALRNLVDMGAHFSKSRGPREFFGMAQKLLDDSRSNYYTLISNIVGSVDHKTLEVVGLNVGYMSWTAGAHKIRQFEIENGYNIPWAVFLDWNLNNIKGLNKIFVQGQAMGIHSYMFIAKNDDNGMPELLSVFQSHPSCAFVIFSDSEKLSTFLSFSEAKMHNVIISLNHSQKNIDENTRALREKKRLWAVHHIYDDENADEITSGKLAEKWAGMGYNLVFLIAGETCSQDTVSKINGYAARFREKQGYPLFIINLFSDVKYVDTVISSEAFTKEFLSDETIILKKDTISKIGSDRLTLAQIFKNSMKKPG